MGQALSDSSPEVNFHVKEEKAVVESSVPFGGFKYRLPLPEIPKNLKEKQSSPAVHVMDLLLLSPGPESSTAFLRTTPHASSFFSPYMRHTPNSWNMQAMGLPGISISLPDHHQDVEALVKKII